MTKAWQVVRVSGGMVLIVLGSVGTILLIIPGIPLLVAGLAIIGFEHPLVRPLTGPLRRWRLLRQNSSRAR